MSYEITQVNDLTTAGEFSVGLNSNEAPNLESTIVEIERYYLSELLGVRLYNKFQAELDAGSGTPNSKKWQDFLDGITYTPGYDEDIDINYLGIKRMLKAFIFHDYMRNNVMKRTGSGTVELIGENSEAPSMSKAVAMTENKYNIGVDLYCMAQRFLKEYELLEEDYTNFLETGAPGTYTMDLSAPSKYLIVGDSFTVSANSQVFSVTDVQPTQITFTGTTGAAASATGTYTYEPFKDLKTRTVHKISML